jgi:aspartate/methionine/tyrosine aminotransferase
MNVHYIAIKGICVPVVQHEVMVTSGANQAFTNIVLTLLDPCDRIVLFVPYYFNHLMAVQMTGGAINVVYGRCNPHSLHPDLDWLEDELSQPNPPKMVVIVNPCNPTGACMLS